MTGTSVVKNKPGIRFDRREASGALGDLGTFIPLLVGMVNQCGLQLGPALLGAGLMNLVTGFAFRIPMPVQPMKAIATVAIAEGLSESQIIAAGIITGAVVLLLGATGWINWLNKVIPKNVVRGLQLALGLKLLNGVGRVRRGPGATEADDRDEQIIGHVAGNWDDEGPGPDV